MGKGAGGSGAARGAGRHVGPLAAAAAGAVVAAAAAGTWRRRRRAIAPADSLAGPPPTPTGELAEPPAAAPVAAPPERPVTADHPRPVPAPASRTASGTNPPWSPAPAADAPPEPSADALAPETLGAPTPVPAASPRAEVPATHAPAAPRPAPPAAAVPVPVDDDPGDAAPPPPDLTAARARRRGRPGARVVAAVVLVVAVLAGGGLAAANGGDDGSGSETSAAARSTTTAPSSTTTSLPAAPEALAAAAQRLEQAGSFTFSGTASATDVSTARPMLWLAVESTITGEVATATGAVHEVATAADGRVAETVAVGPSVWGRRADNRDDLLDEPFESIPALSDADLPAKGAALLPAWLTAAVGAVEGPPDAMGRRTVSATLPAEVLGVVRRNTEPVAAAIVVTFDRSGDPARVEVTSAPDGPPFHLALDLGGLGVPVTIAPPI